MTKIKKKVLVVLLPVMLLAIAFGVFMTTNKTGKAQAAQASFPENVLNDVYYLNDKISLPQSVNAVYNGKEFVLTDSALVYPDGNTYKKDVYELDTFGRYRAVYTLKTEGIILNAEKEFSVITKRFDVSSSHSTAEYGDLTGEFAKNTGKNKGIIVSLASGDTFNYNVPIDLSKKTVNDVITLYTPQTPLTADVGDITVRLTDCYDSSVYVDFLLWFNPNQAVHARAGASGQKTSGFNKNPRVSATGTPVYIDGEEWYMAFDNFGTVMGHGASITSPAGFTWRYDTEKAEVSVNHRSGSFVKVTELANPDIYEKNLFGGFTTGEVYLSVFCDNYYGSAAKIEIEQIGGLTENEIVQADYVDEKAPVLTVNGVPESGIVNVVKGKTVSIFDAKAVDVSGAEVSAAVYYNYDSTKRNNVLVKNGSFVAEHVGAYTIVYTATDRFGNSSSKNVKINCVDVPSGKIIDFAVDEIGSLKAGYEALMPEYVVKGLNGDVTVDVYAVYNGEKTAIENGKFTPMNVGTYEILYEYYDDFDFYTYSYEVESQASDAVVFSDELHLPRYFIKDAEYSLDGIKAYVFTDKNAKAEDAELYVKYDGGEYVKADGKLFKITGNDTVAFKFAYGKHFIESKPVEIVDINFRSQISLSKYFQGDFTAEESSARIRYTSEKTEGDNALKFINALAFDNFSFGFSVPLEAAYNSLAIKLTDFYDENNIVELEFYSMVGAIGVKVNGAEYKTPGTFADGSIKTIYYDNTSKKLVLPGGTSVVMTDPFKNRLCFADIELKGIRGEAFVDIRKVNNQPFTTTYFDIIEPLISAQDVSGKRDIGEKITLSPAIYTDVISPSLYGKLFIEVTDPSDNYVVADNGVKLDGTVLASEEYSFTLSNYGDYRVNYKTVDQAGNEGSLPYVIRVENDVKPTVEIVGDKIVRIKRLAVYNIDNYNVSDDIDNPEDLEVTIIVMDNKQNSVVSVGGEFKAKYAGEYVVYVYCTDKDGNANYACFTLIVE